jgi:hypothetical protein
MHARFRFTVVGLILLVAGCSGQPKLVAVTGKVMHNGTPLTAGSVYFSPQTPSGRAGEKSSSLLQLDGSFTAKTFPYGDGLPPGAYKVTLSPELASRVKKPDYADPAKSPWTLEVPDTGVKDHVFEVK